MTVNEGITPLDVENTSLEQRKQIGTPWGGRFMLVLPWLHYKPTVGDALHGIILGGATGLAIVPVLMHFFALSFMEAIALGIFQSIFISILPNVLCGEPYLPGWLTPLLPLTMIFLGGFTPGVEAVQAMTALVIVISAIFLLFGFTGLGKLFVTNAPIALKGGILIGVAFAGILGQLDTTYVTKPYAAIVATVVALILIFSPAVRNLAARVPFVKSIVLVSLVVALGIAALVGFFAKEIIWQDPIFAQGFWFFPPIADMWQKANPFIVGFPDLKLYITVLPLALAGYIIMYGDLLTGIELVKDAQRSRPNTLAGVVDPIRTHILLAFRNLGHLLAGGPFIPLHGPLWTGGQVFFGERFKTDKKVKNIPSVVTNFYIFSIPFAFILPLMLALKPLMEIALLLTIVLTCFACGFVAMQILQTPTERGIAALIGAVLVAYGPLQGLITGVILIFIIMGPVAFRAAPPAPAPQGTDVDKSS